MVTCGTSRKMREPDKAGKPSPKGFPKVKQSPKGSPKVKKQPAKGKTKPKVKKAVVPTAASTRPKRGVVKRPQRYGFNPAPPTYFPGKPVTKKETNEMIQLAAEYGGVYQKALDKLKRYEEKKFLDSLKVPSDIPKGSRKYYESSHDSFLRASDHGVTLPNSITRDEKERRIKAVTDMVTGGRPYTGL